MMHMDVGIVPVWCILIGCMSLYIALFLILSQLFWYLEYIRLRTYFLKTQDLVEKLISWSIR